MSASPKPYLSPAEYLVIERAAEHKSEYLNGEMFATAGASYAHTRIVGSLVAEFGAAFRGGPCYTLSQEMRVKVSPTGLYTYPDVIILCEPPELEDDKGDTLLNPKVLIEVLSDSTENYDRGKKFHHYQRIASLREYALVSQDESLIERFVRQDDGAWTLTIVRGPEAEFALATVPARISLADIYRGIEFPPEPPLVHDPKPEG